MRNKIFISHANPEDNDQARWLGLQLMTLGYEVWCDVINLKGGEKFWKEIETEIKTKTCKFLYILTKDSNQREGCLNELAVAESAEKNVNDKRFIIALHFDSDLSYDDVNINLKRKIDLNFKTDWQQGFKSLLAIFNEEPKVIFSENPDFDFIRNYWNTIYLNDRKPIEREETYSSNWFSFITLPEHLYVHNFKGMIPKGFDWNKMPFPTCGYKKYTVTFAPASNFISLIPGVEHYNPDNSKTYNTEAILRNNFEDSFLPNRILLNIINYLIRTGFVNTLKKRDLLNYDMSGKTAFCFLKDQNNESLFSFGQLVGKLRDRHWHFAFSGFPDLHHNVFVIKSHILFSENGSIVDSKRVQQAGRRKQGAHWWNKHWKQKLLSAINTLADEDGLLKINVGLNEFVSISSNPMSFKSQVSYIDPDESREPLDDFPEEDNVDSITE